MFRVKQPFFNVDEGGGDWFDDDPIDDETPVDDEQPNEDSETNAEEDGQTSESAADEAEESAADDADNADEDESEKGENDQTMDDDTDIDMGEGRQPVKLSELKQGYLRQSDYTKKTQALAEERKAFEAERESMTPIKQMSDFLTANPYLREQIQQFITEFTHTGHIPLEEALQDAAYGRYINTLMAQNQQLQRELQEVRGKYGELEFSGTMKELKSQLKAEYGELATDEYLQSLEDRAKKEQLPLNVLQEIADSHLAKQKLAEEQQRSKKAAKEAETKTYQKLREKADHLPPGPRKKGQVPNNDVRDNPYEPMEWSEVF